MNGPWITHGAYCRQFLRPSKSDETQLSEVMGSVFVSGALGTGIDVRKASGIGMVPGWPASAVKAMGNTSLAGCRMLLEDARVANLADALIDRITYKHMHDDPEFMKEFMGAVFIPHTNPELLRV